MTDLLTVILDNVMFYLQIIIILIDIAACIGVVFMERRNPQAAIAWLLIMAFLPIVGFIAYLFFGRHLYGAHIFNKKTEADEALKSMAQDQLAAWRDDRFRTPTASGFENTVALLLKSDNAVISGNNQVDKFTDGETKFAAVREAILSAKHHIHMEYFIIRDDALGRDIISLLAKKAAEGVEVRVIFDAAGTFSIDKKKFFGPVRKAGGDVRIFFPLKIPFLNTRLHFRNHRKILVVDGKTGFIGGFNIGDEYLGKGHLGYWRDTHVRIHGIAVASLQRRFIMDWNYAAKDAQLLVENNDNPYFPIPALTAEYGESHVQIASSGPDSPEKAIYSGYLSLIGHARKSIYIHTPYFIPDEPMMTALLLAAKSGVDVRIVIPCKPDHPFVYWANHSYLGDLIRVGARGYTYNDGFIHSKAGIFDGTAVTVGTANWDIRSFKLNFETTAFIYDPVFGDSMKKVFLQELETNCTEITLAEYNSRPLMTKVKEGISRLFSPLL